MSTKSPHMIAVKNRIFKMILWISLVAFMTVAIINLLNQRPFENFIIPFLGGSIMAGMIWLVYKNKGRVGVKYAYFCFLSVLYVPMAWLTSPGSFSAMSFYAVLIVFVGVVLAQEKTDYVFPVLTTIEVVFLLNYEKLRPEQYAVYSEPTARALDLSINFLIVIAIIFAVVFVLNSYFDSEHKRIYSLSITDQLTGIYNRRYLYHELEQFETGDRKKDQTFSILMMDLNNFKRVNDTHGHIAGDEVLKAFGSVLNQACRKNDFPARYGGDEFVVLLPETTLEDVPVIQERINALFGPVMEKYKSVGLSISFGAAYNKGQTIEEILQQADDHLYKNKAASKSEC
jgi:diguanylate cyclase (GGDEF)-like protein